MRLFRNETKEWYHIFVNGEEIVCTGGHPFYVVDKGFVEAKDLKISDKLLLSSGKRAIIEEIQIEQLFEPETTYNFEVADFLTYYVAESDILVHNDCRKEAVRKAWKKEQERLLNNEPLSRDWDTNEIEQLRNNGKVEGYHGHHKKSVKGYPELAGDPDNIQFLTPEEHLRAHDGNWRNITHGEYTGG